MPTSQASDCGSKSRTGRIGGTASSAKPRSVLPASHDLEHMPSDPIGSFKTYTGYTGALVYLCGFRLFRDETRVLTDLATKVRQDGKYQGQQVRPHVDQRQLRRSLRAAWG